MKLFYAQGTGSLACRIMLHETGLDAGDESVNLASKKTGAGADFRTINPAGYVPALVLDDGEILTENVAILYWIARQAPATMPVGPHGPVRLLRALSFIATEVHKPLRPFFTPDASPAERSRAAAAISTSLDLLVRAPAGPYLLGAPFAADAYLLPMLRWVRRFGVAIPPALVAFGYRAAGRRHAQAALAEENLSAV